MPEPTVEEVLQLTDEKVREKSQPSLFWAVTALFTLPPWGIYLLWKEKSFHKVYALCSVILGVLNILTAVSVYTSIYPAFTYIYQQYGVTTPKTTGVGFQAVLLIIFAFIEIITSYWLYKRAKKIGYLERSWLIYMTVIFSLNLLLPLYLIGVMFAFFFSNIYSSSQLNFQSY